MEIRHAGIGGYWVLCGHHSVRASSAQPEVEPAEGQDDVVAVLDRLLESRDKPKTIQVDNGSEFTSQAMDQWAYSNQVTLDFNRPGRPTDNVFIESFNGTLRAECSNQNWFLSLADARGKIEARRQDYAHVGPRSPLGNLTR
jgi:putative transposase